jgi:hypothetical protein
MRRQVEYLSERANQETDLYLKRAYTVNYITALVKLALLFKERGLQKDAYSIESTLAVNGIRPHALMWVRSGGLEGDPKILWQFDLYDEGFRYGY